MATRRWAGLVLLPLLSGCAFGPRLLEKRSTLPSGSCASTAEPDGRVFDWREVTAGLFTVCSVKQPHRPEHAYVAVGHRDYWIYIDDRDHTSKATFT